MSKFNRCELETSDLKIENILTTGIQKVVDEQGPNFFFNQFGRLNKKSVEEVRNYLLEKSRLESTDLVNNSIDNIIQSYIKKFDPTARDNSTTKTDEYVIKTTQKLKDVQVAVKNKSTSLIKSINNIIKSNSTKADKLKALESLRQTTDKKYCKFLGNKRDHTGMCYNTPISQAQLIDAIEYNIKIGNNIEPIILYTDTEPNKQMQNALERPLILYAPLLLNAYNNNYANLERQLEETIIKGKLNMLSAKETTKNIESIVARAKVSLELIAPDDQLTQKRFKDFHSYKCELLEQRARSMFNKNINVYIDNPMFTKSAPAAKTPNTQSDEHTSDTHASNPQTGDDIPAVSPINPQTGDDIPAVPSVNPQTGADVPAVPSVNPQTGDDIPVVPSVNPQTGDDIPAVPSVNPQTGADIPATPSVNPQTSKQVTEVFSVDLQSEEHDLDISHATFQNPTRKIEHTFISDDHPREMITHIFTEKTETKFVDKMASLGDKSVMKDPQKTANLMVSQLCSKVEIIHNSSTAHPTTPTNTKKSKDDAIEH